MSRYKTTHYEETRYPRFESDDGRLVFGGMNRREPKFRKPPEITVRLTDHAANRVRERLLGHGGLDNEVVGRHLAKHLRRGIIAPDKNGEGLNVLGFKGHWFIFLIGNGSPASGNFYNAITFEPTNFPIHNGRSVRVTYELRDVPTVAAPQVP